MKISPMSKAISNKRRDGFDITIVLGGLDGAGNEHEEKEQKELGLAPEGAAPESEELEMSEQSVNQGEDADKKLIHEELMKLGKGSLFHKGMSKKV